jgi:adenylate cyclase
MVGQEGPVPREQVVRWLDTLAGLLRAEGDPARLYDGAARALAELAGLDEGGVAVRGADGWEPATVPAALLDRVAREAAGTFLSGPDGAVVAAPVIAEGGEPDAVLWGRSAEPSGRPCTLVLRLVETLAAAVAAARSRRKVPAAEGQEREVTVLFCDVCGFSRLAERLGPRVTGLLAADALEHVTRCVRARAGVVVDYHGDGVLAMWNAPDDQPDHAERACRAALDVQAGLPRLDVAWHETLGGPLQLGSAVNTGLAVVGNAGSRQQFKYGPIGHTVNLAQRVEAAVKEFGLPVLITGATRQRLGEAFATRRLCRARVAGLREEVDLHELHGTRSTAEWRKRRDLYELALSLFESGHWGATCRATYPLLAGQEGRYDRASLYLVGRAVECLRSPPAAFDPVLELAGK